MIVLELVVLCGAMFAWEWWLARPQKSEADEHESGSIG